VGVDLAPSTPAGSIPRGAPLAGNPRQHSAVTRAVRNPRGLLPLPGLPVYPSAPGANDHVVAGSFTNDNRIPSFPFRSYLLLADLIDRGFFIFSIFSHGKICFQSEFEIESFNLSI